MSDSRVPVPDQEFNGYLNQTADYLLITPPGGVSNWERLLLTAAENTQWQDYKDDWNTKFAVVVANKAQNIQDRNAIELKNVAKENFTEWVIDKNMNKLNRIAAAPEITPNDRAVFHIKLRDDEPTPRPQITDAPFVDFKVESGAFVLVTCRVEHDSTRASMHPDADEIEMRYSLLPTGDPAPIDPAETQDSTMSSKAIFRFSGGIGNAGQRLYGYLRWRNKTDEAKSGPWSQIETIVVSD